MRQEEIEKGEEERPLVKRRKKGRGRKKLIKDEPRLEVKED